MCIYVCVCVLTYLLASGKSIELVCSPNMLLTLRSCLPDSAGGCGAPTWLCLWLRCPVPAVPLGRALLMLTFVSQPLAPMRRGLWPGPARRSGQG